MSEESTKRPGLVTFAAIMLFAVAGMHLVTAIELISTSGLLNSVSFGLFGSNTTVWGVIDLVVAALALYAGIAILQGGSLGRWLGIAFATVSAVRSFWFVWLAPFAALIVIGMDIFIIYGLIMSAAYFEQEETFEQEESFEQEE